MRALNKQLETLQHTVKLQALAVRPQRAPQEKPLAALAEVWMMSCFLLQRAMAAVHRHKLYDAGDPSMLGMN